ncbi:protein SLC31A2-like [Convolutriloba macropyga]|uniref:protein SLC31A2-like n=1 Tax=Convolutriloba macropyga TaxID=536237 RepID=UPI003F52655A
MAHMGGMNHQVDTNDHHTDSDIHLMQFYIGKRATILWERWETTKTWELVLSCFFWCFVAVGYEALKAGRDLVPRLMSRVKPTGSKDISGDSCPQTRHHLSGEHLIQTFLHFLQSSISYLLMLVVMTFNMWLFFSVILGLTVGYFLFGQWKTEGNKPDHCP